MSSNNMSSNKRTIIVSNIHLHTVNKYGESFYVQPEHRHLSEDQIDDIYSKKKKLLNNKSNNTDDNNYISLSSSINGLASHSISFYNNIHLTMI
jgi:hypothetical protein